MEKRIVLLVDYSNLLYRSLHVHRNLSFAGKPTGATYGFITQLTKLINDHHPDEVIVCKDTKPYKRFEDFDGYKADRQPLDKDTWEAVQFSNQQIDKFLDLTGIPTIGIKGWEADDLIAYFTKQNDKDKFIIASNDSDLLQLLKDNVIQLKNKKEYHLEDFEDDYDVTPEEWVSVIALEGSHNAVPGFKGIGTVTAVKIVKSMREDDSLLLDKIGNDGGLEKFEMNKKLIELPHPSFSDTSIIKPRQRKGSDRKLLLFLATLGVQASSQLKLALETIRNE